MLLLLDLDRTLFDTTAFLDAVIDNVLPTICTFDSEHIRSLFDVQSAGSGSLLYELNYDSIFRDIGVSFDQFSEAACAVLIPNQFVYDDATQLLQLLESTGDIKKTSILSFGNRSMQELKVKLSPSLGAVPLLTTQTYKRDYIVDNVTTDKGFLVDDKPGQNLPINWVEIHLNRAAQNEPKQLSDSIWQISTLVDVQTIIQ